MLEKVDTLVVDKTGTLTEGKPSWRPCTPLRLDGSEVLRLAAARSSRAASTRWPPQSSQAPRARIAACHRAAKISSPSPGKGVRAPWTGRRVSLGNSTLLGATRHRLGRLSERPGSFAAEVRR